MDDRDSEKTREQLLVEIAGLRRKITEFEMLESHRRQSEMLLQEVEERYNMLFNLSQDAYYISDLKGTFLEGNEAAERIIGYSKDELIGKSFLKLDLLPLKQVTKAMELLAKNALGKPTGPDEFTLKRKDGNLIPVEISTTPMKIRGETIVLGIVHSVEEMKRLENKLEKSEEQFRLIFENVNDAIVRLDASGTIVAANSRLEDIFGYKPEEIIGRNFASLGLFNPVDMPKILGLFGSVLKGEASHLVELHPKHKDGRKVAMEASVSILKKGSEIEGIFVIARDITGRKEES